METIILMQLEGPYYVTTYRITYMIGGRFFFIHIYIFKLENL